MTDVKLVLAVAASLVWLLWASPALCARLFKSRSDKSEIVALSRHVGSVLALVLMAAVSVLVVFRIAETR